MANEPQDLDLQNLSTDIAIAALIVNGDASLSNIPLRLGGTARSFRNAAASVGVGPAGPQGPAGVNGSTGSTGSAGTTTATGPGSGGAVTGSFDIPGQLIVGDNTQVGASGTRGGFGTLANWIQSQLKTQLYGVGYYLGLYNYGVNVLKSTSSRFINGVRGLGISVYAELNQRGFGDSAAVYAVNNTDGGNYLYMDNGQSAIFGQLNESGPGFKGTISATSGLNDQTPTLAYVSGNNWTTDGSPFINMTKGNYSGYLNNSQGGLVANSFCCILPVTSVIAGPYFGSRSASSLPLTTAFGSATGADPGKTTDQRTSYTINVQCKQLGSGAAAPFVVGFVAIAGYQYFEQTYITAVGTMNATTKIQSVTLTLRYPHATGMELWQGGIAGQYMCFDYDYAATGFHLPVPAVGSFDGTSIIYAYYMPQFNGPGAANNSLAGSFTAGTGNLLPRLGSQFQTLTGSFNLFPGAEIIGNRNTTASPTLDQNNCTWAVGDVVENPHFHAQFGNALNINYNVQHPRAITTGSQATQAGSSVGMFQMTGPGCGLGMYGVRIINQQSGLTANGTSMYKPGGPLLAPVGLSIEGPFYKGISFTQMNQNLGDGTALIQIENLYGFASQSSINVDLPIIDFASCAGGSLTYNPNQNTFGMKGSNFNTVSATFTGEVYVGYAAQLHIANTGDLTTSGKGQFNNHLHGNSLSTACFRTSVNFTTDINTGTVLVDTTAGPVTVTVDSSIGALAGGSILTFKKINNATNLCSINFGGKAVDGSTAIQTLTQYQILRVQWDGTAFWKV